MLNVVNGQPRNLCWKPETIFGSSHHLGFAPSRICYFTVWVILYLVFIWQFSICFLVDAGAIPHRCLHACACLWVWHIFYQTTSIYIPVTLHFGKIHHETLQWILCWLRSFVRLNSYSMCYVLSWKERKDPFRGADLQTKPHVLQKPPFLYSQKVIYKKILTNTK